MKNIKYIVTWKYDYEDIEHINSFDLENRAREFYEKISELNIVQAKLEYVKTMNTVQKIKDSEDKGISIKYNSGKWDSSNDNNSNSAHEFFNIIKNEMKKLTI